MKTLTNPFEIYSERNLLIPGIIAVILIAFVASSTDHLIFGSLKVINNYKQTWIVAILNLSITLFSNAIVWFVYARLRYNKTRFVDVLNVVLIAHIVVYLMLCLTALPFVQDAITTIELEVLDKGFQSPEISKIHMFILGFFGILTLFLLIYFFYLVAVGMKIAMNSKSKVDVLAIIILVFIWNTVLQFVNPFL